MIVHFTLSVRTSQSQVAEIDLRTFHMTSMLIAHCYINLLHWLPHKSESQPWPAHCAFTGLGKVGGPPGVKANSAVIVQLQTPTVQWRVYFTTGQLVPSGTWI